MALDRVKPLKLESIDTGGDQNDEFPTSLNPEEDHIECAGIVLDDPGLIDESTVLWRDASDMKFKDTRNPGGFTLTELAESAGGGITEAQHEALDTLTHWVSETNWQEIVRSDGHVTNVINWETSNKLKKVRECIITRSLGKVSQLDIIQYDATGVEKLRLTGVITRASGKVASIQWTKAVA